MFTFYLFLYLYLHTHKLTYSLFCILHFYVNTHFTTLTTTTSWVHIYIITFIQNLKVVLMKHWRMDLLLHHGVALTGIISLVYNQLYPCSSAPVAATELISIFRYTDTVKCKCIFYVVEKSIASLYNSVHHLYSYIP